MKQTSLLISLALAGMLGHSTAMAAPTAVATWNFNGTLAADEPSVAALTAIDPLGTSAFITDSVFGVPLVQVWINNLHDCAATGRCGFDFDECHLYSPAAKLISWPGIRQT